MGRGVGPSRPLGHSRPFALLSGSIVLCPIPLEVVSKDPRSSSSLELVLSCRRNSERNLTKKVSVSNSVENKQLFYAIDKVYYILISFLTMNCKLTNLIFVFFRSIDLFSFFFQTTNCWLAIPGVVLVGVRVRAFPSTPGAGCSRLRDSYPPSPPPTTL